MIKPKSKLIAKSKISAPKASVYLFIGSAENLNLIFILIYYVHISLLKIVYSNIYLDRYLAKKKYNNYYRRRKQDPRTESKPIQAEFRR